METARTCFDCGRSLPRREIPSDASREWAECIKASERTCTWCIDRNLVAGGFDVENILSRYDGDERAELEAAALRRRSDLLLDSFARRRAREARPEKAQEALI